LSVESLASETEVSAARRVAWGIADQALSSVTNFGLAVLAARALGAQEFGAFSIAFTAYTFALGISRATASEPLVMRFSGENEAVWRRGVGPSAGAALILGVVGGASSVVVGLVVGGTLGEALIVSGLALPFLLVQDQWRFAFFANGRGHLSFANDLAWALIQFPVLLILVIVTDSPAVGWLLLAWGGAAGVAAVLGAFQAGVTPKAGRVLWWWREQRDIVPRILGEFVAVTGGSSLALFGIAAVAGLSAAGAIRGAQVLLGPVNVLILGVSIVAIPEMVVSLKRSPSSLRRRSVLFSCGLGICSLVWGGFVMVLPTTIGVQILGDTWTTAHSVVPGVIVWQTGLAVSIGAVAGLRALAAVKRSLRVRIVVAPLVVGGGLAGAIVAGARGASLGLGAANALAAVVWWFQLQRALREYEFTRGQDPGGRSTISLA
jgi:O-antigen/teichoic acid export membrane protein